VPAFLPGLALAARLHTDLVRPQLAGVRHSAALLGPGSEVLGHDTPRSTDHDWGARLQVFAPEPVRLDLPAEFLGWPVTVTVLDLGDWLHDHLGVDPRAPLGVLDWLALPTQTLAEFTAGAVFHDGLAELEPARRALAWYPDQVWRYVLAAQWHRIAEEEAFVGRCAEVGDDLGSAVVAARLARDLMRLALLQHRRYPPYSKWLGTEFAALPNAPVAALTRAVTGPDRAEHLVTAYRYVGETHNRLGLTAPLSTHPRPYYERPYPVLAAARFAEALRATLTTPDLRTRPLTGAVDQYTDSVDVARSSATTRSLTAALTPPDPHPWIN
jgi:hypothetical protein